MRFNTLACDYDGTLTLNGTVDEATVASLERYRAAGGTLILVTGRELPELFQVFHQTPLFTRVVAENGGVIYDPEARRSRGLADSPPEHLVSLLRRKRVEPLSIGRVLIATREPHHGAALEAIHELGLEYHIIFNKGAVMILPSAVNKASGLKTALEELNSPLRKVAGIGDAENDHAFLQVCGYSAAVANALPSLKQNVDFVTPLAAGQGVAELIDRLIAEPDVPETSTEPVVLADAIRSEG